ncbi:Hypothetical predicted protein [Pelobates cultripes]|uniref:Uncharacterized protein n=1 Tax=Pelobates cultripes TaxID=61616 RepID=A0AAD1RZV7_PELCU|nr:Hypothetical predicted protein [Pelobates cultripes]
MFDNMATKLQDTLQRSFTDLRTDIQALGTRTSELEAYMEAHVEADNRLVNRVEDAWEKINGYKVKMADLEDRARRSNLRLRNGTENIGPQDLPAYATGLIRLLVPDMPQDVLLMDRIHRVAKPQYLPADTKRRS